MNIEIVNPVDLKNWDELILSFPGYSFFHTSYWSKLLQKTYSYSPKYFIKKDGREIKAILPLMLVQSIFTGKRAVALPFSDYCQPLTKDKNSFTELWNEVLRFSSERKMKYVEIRGGEPLFDNIKPSTFDYNHTLNLSVDEEDLFKGFSVNTKRNIKKAIKENVEVEITGSERATEEFYEMNCVTRKKHGLPPQPRKFFLNLYELILKQNLGFISLARLNGRVIAGALYLLIGDKAIYKYGASHPEYLNKRANNLVMWEAIKHCSEKGFKSFCFGRTEPDNEGLRRFKLGWGTEESELKIYRYDIGEKQFVTVKTKTSGFHNKVFEKTPLPLLKLFGSITYKHFG